MIFIDKRSISQHLRSISKKWNMVHQEEKPGMSILKSSLTRRAFTALAGAAMIAGMSPVASFAQDVTIPIIVKDTTSFYWQIVLAGARAAGKDLGVNVPELGAQSESDINGQISILENAVAGAPAAVVISPTEFKALGKPIDEAAKAVPIIGIDRLRCRLQGLLVVPHHRQRPGRPHRCRWSRCGGQGNERQGRG
jgi:hypothetical protein